MKKKMNKKYLHRLCTVVQALLFVPLINVIYDYFVYQQSIIESTAFQTCILLFILANLIQLRLHNS